MKVMSTQEETKGLVNAIRRSQHCQRNFDLSEQIPQEHIEILKVAATECPSKQNVAHYKLHFITDPGLISKIHELTPTEKVHDLSLQTTNSQTLANLLVVFESYRDMSDQKDQTRNDETSKLYLNNEVSAKAEAVLERDANVAVGIAAGYLNLAGSLLGYRTGCCQCMDQDAIKNLLGLEGQPMLLMGIGYHDETRSRLVHATDETYMFPTRGKQKILVQDWPGSSLEVEAEPIQLTQ